MTQSTTALRKDWVEIDVNGSPMETYFVRPEGSGPWPAVIVFMEIFGVNSHIRDVAERVAAEGYVAVAPNYYHRTTRNLELGYTEETMAIGREHKDKTTREGLLSDIRAVLDWLARRPEVKSPEQVGCMGFCFGGHVAYIAAAFNEIVATAAFYGGGIATMSPGGGQPTVAHTGEITGEILCLFGEKDPLIPHEDTVTVENALKEEDTQHTVVRYPNAGHGFFCDQRADYDPQAAQDAWRRVTDLFARNLK